MRLTMKGVAIALCCVAPVAGAGAQSLAQRVAQSDGVVEIVYPSRPNVCGDGEGAIANLFGRSQVYSANNTYSGHGSWANRPCEHGPARAEVSVASGEVTRIRAFVGPLHASGAGVRIINASAVDVATWLTDLITTGNGRIPSDAMLPLLLADAPEPWPLMLTVARDQNRSRSTREAALMWLGSGITDKLGLGENNDRQSDDDELREQAVFVLSQRPKSESVPELIELAKTGKYPVVRRSAIFWLGQSGDPRAADTYAELLKSR